MRGGSWFVALALAACSPAGEAPPAPGDDARSDAAAPGAPAIAGEWRILSLDGRTLAGRPDHPPRLAFAAASYGGTVGCNHFGGLGLADGGRYYTAPGPQTVMGCGELSDEEAAATRLLGASPMIAFDGADGLTLRGGGHVLTLRRQGPLPEGGSPEPVSLAGTEWLILSIDGQRLPAPGEAGVRLLRFEAATWAGQAACATLSGAWRQANDRIELTDGVATTEQLCPPEQAATDARLAALMKANPRFVAGPNGELLLGGGGHWLVAERARDSVARDDGGVIDGRWNVAAVRGTGAVSEPGILFRRGTYAGGTGCNSFVGMYVAQGRRLYTFPGVQTAQGCGGALGVQERNLIDVLRRSPRIALGEEPNALMLDDGRGGIRLRRASDDPRSIGPYPTPGLPRSGRYWVVALNGETVMKHYSEPKTHLTLAPGRWTLTRGCATLTGVWRARGEGGAFFTDASPDRKPGCDTLAKDPRVMRLFNGEARALTDANADLLIAGDDHWLNAHLDRSPRR